MMKFWKRLDRLIDTMIEADSIVPAGGRIRPVKIRLIFENLRYYTVLAFMWLGVKLLREDGTALSEIAVVILTVATFLLGALVAMQTSAIIITASAAAFTALLPPRKAVVLRRAVRSDDNYLKFAVITLLLPVIFGVLMLGGALFSALARSGAI